MTKKVYKIFFLLGLALLMVTFMAACGSGAEEEAAEPVEETTTTPEVDEPSANEPEEEEQEAINLSLAHLWPAVHTVETNFVQPWAEEIERETGGLITITSYPGETLLSGTDIYEGVVSGVADMGISFFSYNSGRFPTIELLELPGIQFNNSKVGSTVSWEIIQEIEPDDVSDTKLLMTATTGSAYLITVDAVETVDDLKGLEVRTTGASADAIEALGGVPIAMPMSDAYESLSRGIVKGVLAPTDTIKGWNFDEVTNYVTVTPFMYSGLSYLTMNKSTWESIPADLQETFLRVTAKHHEKLSEMWDKGNEEGLQYGIEAGMETIHLSDEVRAEWMQLLEEKQAERVKELEEKGIPAQEILDRIKALAEEYNDKFAN